MNHTFQSATVKLTAYYLAIIMVICLMFSAAIYHFAANELQHSLASQTQRLVHQYPGFDFTPTLRATPDYREGSARILRNLIYFNLFVLLLAGFAAYGLARRTLEPIQASHEQQKRFTADVSHELRTPLTALKMSTEVALLDDKAGKPLLRDALSSNLEEANKLEQLINNLLRLTRLEAAELQHSFEPVELSKIVRDAVTDVTDRASANRITIADTITRDLPAVGDQASLQQLFGILLDNALKYSPSGSRITVSGHALQGVSAVSISDEGSGIDAKALPHIFDRFYRADSARSSSSPTTGFGLGLSIAKHIADIHEGTIRITSAAGKGTTAVIELPAAKT